MAARRVDKEQKRRDILHAAMEVFAEKGVYDFKMIDIANAAGVGKGTLYEYFKSKEELVGGCLDLHAEQYFSVADDWQKEELPPPERIKSLIEYACEIYIANRERLTLMFDFWAVTFHYLRTNKEQARWLESARGFQRLLARVIEEGVRGGFFRPVDANLVASMLFAVLDGLMFQVVMGMIDCSSRDLAAKVYDLVIGGIRK